MKRAAIKRVLHPLTGLREQTAAAPAARLYVRESDFLAEEIFLEILCFERKQSERSGKEILLMLIDLGGTGDVAVRNAIARESARTVSAGTEERAVRGWYRRDAILGFLLPMLDEAARDALREAVFRRLPSAAQEPPVRPSIEFRSFPEQGPGGNGQGTYAPFYADLRLREKTRRLSRIGKRAMDIAGGIAGLCIFFPFFLVIPLCIKATSPGPVLFRQERMGQYGRKFIFLKFRTMSENNDSAIHREYIKKLIRDQKSYTDGGEGGPVYKIQDDPRVTPFGRLLRKSSLDELPQFLNVLRGEMSLVGPRPPIQYEFEQYDLWHRRRVMEIKPGITGLWQVSGRSSTSFDEMVRLDLKYAKEWSLWLDIRILFKTIWVMLAGRGGY